MELTAITDREGNYTITDVPVTYTNQPVTVTAAMEGFVTASQSALLYNSGTATVNFILERSYSNSGSTVRDGMVFTVATEKSLYHPGEFVNVRYTVTNTSNRIATYNFNSTCQFDMMMQNAAGETVNHYMEGRGCGDALTEIVLNPGESTVMDFEPFYLVGTLGHYTVSAWLIGYEGQSVSTVTMELQPMFVDVKKQGPEKRTEASDVLFKSEGKTIVLDLHKLQNISVDAFTLNGRRIGELSFTRTFPAGKHEVNLDIAAVPNQTFVLRVRGDRFSGKRLIRK
jgi:hypothetical protein